MRILYILVAAFLMGIPAFANDGAFFSQGEQIFPVKETTVELKKEILNFKYTGDDYINVEVYFEFYNPGEAKEVLVGFESPGATGDVMGDSSFIRNFTVIHDNKKLSFKHYTDPPGIKKSGDDDEDQYLEYKHIFSFKVKFKNGLNIIKHSYQYKGSSFVYYKNGYDYILTTGNRWANSEIEDFELNIDMGSNVLFQLPYSMEKGKKAEWKLTGQGKSRAYEDKDWDEKDRKETRFMVQSGLVQLKDKHFKPARELKIIVYNDAIQSYFDLHEPKNDSFVEALIKCVYESYEGHECDPDKMDKAEIKRLRNFFYAVKGYSFKDESLRNFFEQYEWYYPNPELKMEDIKFDDYVVELIQKAKALEKMKKEEVEGK